MPCRDAATAYSEQLSVQDGVPLPKPLQQTWPLPQSSMRAQLLGFAAHTPPTQAIRPGLGMPAQSPSALHGIPTGARHCPVPTLLAR